MTKHELINSLRDDGVFELTQEIIDIINSDNDETHASANKDLLGLINSIHQMQNWTLFSWKSMVDLATQAYGFEKYAAYNKLNACADIEEPLDDLHSILWTKYSNFGEA
jgi:hypothetical protein